MGNSRFVCILSVEFRREGGETIAHCPELRLTDHGATKKQAEARLLASVNHFIEICAEKGTLIKLLRDRGALELERNPEHSIQVPVPLLALRSA